MMSNHIGQPIFAPTARLSGDALSATGDPPHADGIDVTPTASSGEMLPSPTTAGGKKRKSSKMKNGKQLSRSASTPQMRDAAAMSDSDDKKRNKLGYQRISIACAHCRRRKIRCVLSDGDTQQRCQNCIRLKKECVFYPVDQQAALENKADSTSQPIPGSGPSSVVSSSPPIRGTDRPFDPTRDIPPFSSVPSNAPNGFHSHLPLEPGSALPGQGYAQREYAYRNDNDLQSWPSSSTLSVAGNSIVSDHGDTGPHAFARLPVTTGSNGDFSPFPANDLVHVSPNAPNPHAFNLAQRNDMFWQPTQPLRSMSYSHIDTLSGNPSNYASPFQPHQRSPMSNMQYPPHHALDAQRGPPMPREGEPHSAPLSSQDPSFSHQHPYMFPPEHGNAGNASAPHPHTYPNSWYPEHAPFGTLQEEPEHYGSGQRRPG